MPRRRSGPGPTHSRNVPLWTALVTTVLACVLAAVHARGAELPGLATLEGLSLDTRFRLRGARALSTDRVVIVGIDDRARERDPELVPTRRGHARLLDAITACDPKLVALDYFFASPEQLLPEALAARVKAIVARPVEPITPTTPTAPEPAPVPALVREQRELLAAIAEELRGDEVLAAAIARSRRVVLGAFFPPGPPGAPGDAPEPVGLKLARLGEVADAGGGDAALRPISAAGVVFTLPDLARGAVGAGAVNDLRDADGVRRRMPLVIEHGGRHYMSLGLAVALADQGRPRDTRYVAGAPTLQAGDLALTLTRAASLPLDVPGRDRIPRVSAADVLDGSACGQLAGKLVFVGMTFAAFDKVSTPYDPTADGIELHAILAENLLAGKTLHTAGALATVLATLLLCGLVCIAQLRRLRRRAWTPPLFALAGIAIYVVVATVLFARGTIVAMAAPIAAATLTTIAATIAGLATEGREKAHLRAVFSQYVSRAVVDRILAGGLRLGGERKELTVLFSDIRGFSQLAEGMTPEELAAFLGEYLTPMTDLVLASGGTLDKYIGDAIMAFWGAPADEPAHARRGCEVALAMGDALEAMNAQRRAHGQPAIAIGIGLNTGAMAVGNMGSAARFEYTVLGDQVNLASRLEALTKEYGVQILVGEATAKAAGDAFVFRELDLVRVKGRATAAPVFELVGRAGAEVPARWAAALADYRARRFDEARAAFLALDGDPAAAVLARRCEVLAADPPPADWDGVYEQRSK